MSPRHADEFRDPFGDLEAEPVTDYQIGAVSPAGSLPAENRGRAVVQRGGYVRLTPVRPAEKRRKPRKLTVTFSDSRTVQRLRALAEKWDVRAPNGEPNVSLRPVCFPDRLGNRPGGDGHVFSGFADAGRASGITARPCGFAADLANGVGRVADGVDAGDVHHVAGGEPVRGEGGGCAGGGSGEPVCAGVAGDAVARGGRAGSGAGGRTTRAGPVRRGQGRRGMSPLFGYSEEELREAQRRVVEGLRQGLRRCVWWAPGGGGAGGGGTGGGGEGGRSAGRRGWGRGCGRRWRGRCRCGGCWRGRWRGCGGRWIGCGGGGGV